MADFAPWIHRILHVGPTEAVQTWEDSWIAVTYTLLVCLDGSARVERDGTPHPLVPGASALAESGSRLQLSPGFRGLVLNGELVRRERGIELLPTGRVRTHLLCWEPQPSWRELFGGDNPVLVPPPLADETPALVQHLAFTYLDDAPSFLAANHLLTGWVLRFRTLAGRSDAGAGTAASFAGRIEVLIDEGLREGITATRLAAICGLSRVGLDRRYRRERGRSVAAAIAAARLRQACDLLRTSPYGDDITTTARRLGFGGGSAFARWFRRCTGLAPSAWRRRERMTFGLR